MKAGPKKFLFLLMWSTIVLCGSEEVITTEFYISRGTERAGGPAALSSVKETPVLSTDARPPARARLGFEAAALGPHHGYSDPTRDLREALAVSLNGDEAAPLLSGVGNRRYADGRFAKAPREIQTKF